MTHISKAERDIRHFVATRGDEELKLLQDSFRRLEAKLRYDLNVVKEEKQNVIPVVSFNKIHDDKLPKAVVKQIQKYNLFVHRL